MAFLPPKKKVDEEPVIQSSTAPSTQAPVASQSPAPANQAPGSRLMTNLDAYLRAGGNANAQRIQNKGSELLSAERGDFNRAADPLRNASYAPTSLSTDKVNSLMGTIGAEGSLPGSGLATGASKVTLGGSSPMTPGASVGGVMGGSVKAGQPMTSVASPIGADAAEKTIRDALSNTYTGPMTVDYDPSKSGRLSNIGNLLGDNTAASVTMGSGKANQRTSGEKALGSALLAGDARVGNVQKELGTSTDKFASESGAEKKSLEDKATGFKKAAEDANAANLAQMQNFQRNVDHRNEGQAQTATNADSAAKQAYLEAYKQWYESQKSLADWKAANPSGGHMKNGVGRFTEGTSEGTPRPTAATNNYTTTRPVYGENYERNGLKRFGEKVGDEVVFSGKYTPGEVAGASNFVDPAEAAQLSFLNQVLGTGGQVSAGSGAKGSTFSNAGEPIVYGEGTITPEEMAKQLGLL